MELPDRDGLAIYSGSANPELAAETARLLGRELGKITLVRHPDTEIGLHIEESIRGKHVFVIQPLSPPVNEHAMELFLMLDAFRRASAQEVTAVVPYYGYSRQERKAAPRESISAKLIADFLTVSGADRAILLDVHAPAIQGFFNIPVDSLTAVHILTEHLRRQDLSDHIIVAADSGRVKMAERFADALELPLGFMNKRRRPDGSVVVTQVVGEIAGRTPIVIDDIIAGGSLVRAQLASLVEAGARTPFKLVVVHALLVGNALEAVRERASLISEFIVTNSVRIPDEKRFESLRVVSLAPLFADAIRRTYLKLSMSPLFQLE